MARFEDRQGHLPPQVRNGDVHTSFYTIGIGSSAAACSASLACAAAPAAATNRPWVFAFGLSCRGLKIAIDVARGLHYLHARNIVHVRGGGTLGQRRRAWLAMLLSRLW